MLLKPNARTEWTVKYLPGQSHTVYHSKSSSPGKPKFGLYYCAAKVLLVLHETLWPGLDMRHGQERDKYNHRFSRVFYLIPPNAMLMVVCCCCCSFWLLVVLDGNYWWRVHASVSLATPPGQPNLITTVLLRRGRRQRRLDNTKDSPSRHERHTNRTLGVGELCRGRYTPFGLLDSEDQHPKK